MIERDAFVNRPARGAREEIGKYGEPKELECEKDHDGKRYALSRLKIPTHVYIVAITAAVGRLKDMQNLVIEHRLPDGSEWTRISEVAAVTCPCERRAKWTAKRHACLAHKLQERRQSVTLIDLVSLLAAQKPRSVNNSPHIDRLWR